MAVPAQMAAARRGDAGLAGSVLDSAMVPPRKRLAARVDGGAGEPRLKVSIAPAFSFYDAPALHQAPFAAHPLPAQAAA